LVGNLWFFSAKSVKLFSGTNTSTLLRVFVALFMTLVILYNPLVTLYNPFVMLAIPFVIPPALLRLFSCHLWYTSNSHVTLSKAIVHLFKPFVIYLLPLCAPLQTLCDASLTLLCTSSNPLWYFSYPIVHLFNSFVMIRYAIVHFFKSCWERRYPAVGNVVWLRYCNTKPLTGFPWPWQWFKLNGILLRTPA